MASIKVVAKYDYTHHGAPDPKGRTFFSFVKGDTFTVLERGTTDWWEVSRADGERGFVPLNYVETAPSAGNAHRRGGSAHKVAHLFAVFDYKADGGKLSLVATGAYDVKDGGASKEGWCMARDAKTKLTGKVPRNYLGTLEEALSQQDWYHGRITEEETATRLAVKKKDGYYLVRTDPATDKLMLCIRIKKSHKEIEILVSSAGYEVQGNGEVRESLPSLLSLYAAVVIKTGWGKLKKLCPPPKKAVEIVKIEPEPEAVTQPVEENSGPREEELSMEERVAAIDEELELIHASASGSGLYSAAQRQRLAELVERRSGLMKLQALMQGGHVMPSESAPSTAAAGYQPDGEGPRAEPVYQNATAVADPAQTAASTEQPGPQAAQNVYQNVEQAMGRLSTGDATDGTSQEKPAGGALNTSNPFGVGAAPQAAASKNEVGNPFAATGVSSNPFASSPNPANPPASPSKGSVTGAKPASPAPTSSSVATPQRRAPATPMPQGFALRSPISGRRPMATGLDGPLDMEKTLDGIGHGIIQMVRDEAGVSFDAARLAAVSLARHILQGLQGPEAQRAVAEVLMRGGGSEAEGGHDLQRLNNVAKELTEMKNDAQQRSWSVYDDSPVIREYIEEFVALVTEGDPAVTKRVIREWSSPGQVGFYEIVETLVVYYQMETRNDLRLALLRLFGCLGELDTAVFGVLLNSVLPVEMARDIMVEPNHPQNCQRISYSLLLCSMILSLDEPLPVNHFEFLGDDFIRVLLDLVEREPETEDDEQLVDLSLNLLLAFNLQQPRATVGRNAIMEGLMGHGCKVFSEKLLLMVNRGSDPVLPAGGARNSLMRMLQDIFASKATGQGFFYTNDLWVLVDVVTRELTDRVHGDPQRNEYLLVLGGIFMSSTYFEEPHRPEVVRACLQSLATEENPDDDASTTKLSAHAQELLQRYFVSESDL